MRTQRSKFRGPMAQELRGRRGRGRHPSAEVCRFDATPRSAAAAEAGCPLDHCPCGTHDPEAKHHVCRFDDQDEEVRAAERAAGWDPSP